MTGFDIANLGNVILTVSKNKYIQPLAGKESLNGLRVVSLAKADSFEINRANLFPKNELEYLQILEELSNFVHPEHVEQMNGKSLFQYNKPYYPNVPEKFKGLLPYCGLCDISSEINRYLSGRKLKYLSDNQAQKFCKILNYSLRALDKEFGKYRGIVYRAGYFSPNKSKQFFSSTNSLDNVDTVLAVRINENNPELNIINTNCGHKIYEFQKKYCENPMMRIEFIEENEVLLGGMNKYLEFSSEVKDKGFKHNTKFRKLHDDMKMIANSMQEFGEMYCFDGFDYKTIFERIKVWREL